MVDTPRKGSYPFLYEIYDIIFTQKSIRQEEQPRVVPITIGQID